MDGGALLVLAINPGHDGAVAVVRDRELVLSLEAEKDSCPRHSRVTPFPLLDAAEPLEEVPDMVAIRGWLKNPPSVTPSIACGYWEPLDKKHEERRFFGRPVTMFSSSHVRSHIMSAVGMAPRDDASTRAVLVWEGLAGSFYMLDERFEVTGEIPVLTHPGN